MLFSGTCLTLQAAIGWVYTLAGREGAPAMVVQHDEREGGCNGAGLGRRRNGAENRVGRRAIKAGKDEISVAAAVLIPPSPSQSQSVFPDRTIYKSYISYIAGTALSTSSKMRAYPGAKEQILL